MKKSVESIIKSLSLKEKASLCSGKDFWHLEGYEDKGIPSVMLTDGPHGLRKQAGESDHVGLNDSVPATCFPTASALASSWNQDLLYKVGQALGEECLQEKVAVLLGPGLNIKRSPLCGRNFEYFSEDPYQGGKLAASFIKGVQSKGIGTSLKHFAVNNQEKRRMSVDAVVDDRALRELYLSGFEIAVKESKPQTVMCAYNKLNGEYCSENSNLLTDILKKDWGFEGFLVTDWGACNDRVKGLKAGQDLEMPSSMGINDQKIVDAVESGQLDEAILDERIRRILKVVLSNAESLKKDFSYDKEAHHELARQAEVESAVLLKNNGILPLSTDKTLALIGDFARTPRYQGSGSSLVNAQQLDNAWDSIAALFGGEENLLFAQGYDPESEDPDNSLIEEAVECAKRADRVLLFAGLPEISESEGFDREHMAMPASHNALIEAVAAVNPQTVVILSNGSPVEMPWLENTAAVLESYLGGEAWGSAVCDLLFGKANPSGKLAETFPLSLNDLAASQNFPGGTQAVHYAESLYVGYRWFDKVHKPVQFPFGYGLSYTRFEYSDLQVQPHHDSATVQFTLKNTGDLAGAEIVQLYVKDCQSTLFRPEKELKGFSKEYLEPGEARSIRLELDRRAFCCWDSGQQKWVLEAGDFEILVAASSADIRLKTTIAMDSQDSLSPWAQSLSEIVPAYYEPQKLNLRDHSESGDFARLYGVPLPSENKPLQEKFTRYSTLEEMRTTPKGKKVADTMMNQAMKMFGEDPDPKTLAMMKAMFSETPLHKMSMMSGGEMTMDMVDHLLNEANGMPDKG